MARYSPALSPLVLKALHHEAKRRGIPMTRLADTCITSVLRGTPGWEEAEREWTVRQRNEVDSSRSKPGMA